MQTRRTILTLAAASLLGAAPAAAPVQDPVEVVATIPDLADLAREIGGDAVEVRSLSKGTMNVHAVPVRPSSLIAVNQADLFVQMGLSLEHTYVPGLLMRARNRDIEPGQPGFVDCSVGWEPIDVPVSLSRSQGVDLHPLGNPHYNLSPAGGRQMADRILEGLLRVDPDRAEGYRARHAELVARIDGARAAWDELTPKLKGRKVVAYHTDFDYFLRYHGIELVATLEPKPGVPPTPRHLAEVVERMRAEDVEVVLTAKWSNDKSVRFVAEKTGAKIVEGPVLAGGVKGADTWIASMEVLHERMVAALGGP